MELSDLWSVIYEIAKAVSGTILHNFGREMCSAFGVTIVTPITSGSKEVKEKMFHKTQNLQWMGTYGLI